MAYWFPPTPDGFDPFPRPFRWHMEKDPYTGGNTYFPEEEDAILFGLGWNQTKGLVNQYYDDSKARAEGLLAPDQGVLAGEIWKPDTIRFGNTNGWYKWRRGGESKGLSASNKSEYERLSYYNKMIMSRTPEDPNLGGLVGDEAYEDGTIKINYFDMSDETWPKRKKVLYVPKGDGVDVKIYQWDLGKQKWEEEGPDAEKGIIKSLPDIIKGFTAITTAIVSVMTANPAIASAWSSIAGMSSSAALGGPPPNLMQFASSAVLFINRAPGFDEVMTKIINPVIKSEFIQSIRGGMARAGNDLTSFTDKTKKVAEVFGKSIPQINVSSVISGQLPPLLKDATKKGEFDAQAFLTAGKAFLQNDPNYTESLRKTIADKDVFDATLISLEASKRTKGASRIILVPDPANQFAFIQTTPVWIRENLISLIRQLEKKYGLTHLGLASLKAELASKGYTPKQITEMGYK